MLRARLLSADEIRRLVAAREARWQRWDEAYDAVERWKAEHVSQARNARAADRRRSKVNAYGDEAFGAAYWRAKEGRAWALAGDAGMAAKEAVEALLTRSILTVEEFTAYFGAWADVIGEPSPRYFVGAPLGQLVLLSIRRLGRAAKAWLGRQPATIQLFALAIIVLVLLALFRAI